MSLARAWFITGTDTEVGKTFITCALLHAARNAGFRAVGMKPVAAGAERHGNEWINEDVARLREAGSFDPGNALINPCCLRDPVAPHIAAHEENRPITPQPLLAAFDTLRTKADIVLVEGVGGFCVPLGKDYDTADLACDFALPVILVVGMRLGCINHALLTQEAIRARGLTLEGWVANRIDPDMLRFAANMDALRTRLQAPLLGISDHITGPDAVEQAAKQLHLPMDVLSTTP